jgi:hypothetical protein
MVHSGRSVPADETMRLRELMRRRGIPLQEISPGKAEGFIIVAAQSGLWGR